MAAFLKINPDNPTNHPDLNTNNNNNNNNHSAMNNNNALNNNNNNNNNSNNGGDYVGKTMPNGKPVPTSWAGRLAYDPILTGGMC